MLGVHTSNLCPLREVCKHMPRSRDRPVHPSTIKRWVLSGVGPDRVKLAAVRLGGRWYTTQEDIQRFIKALSGDAAATAATTHQRERQDKKRQDMIDRELAAYGL